MDRALFPYLLKSWILIVCLFVLSCISHYFPAFMVIGICVLVSSPTMFVLIYAALVHKRIMEKHYVKDCFLSRLNSRKFFCITMSFCISIISTFLMFLEISTWQMYDWIAIILLVPLFYFGYKQIKKVLSTQFVGLYIETNVLRWCGIIIPIVMIIIYFVCDYLFIPHEDYNNIIDAILYYQHKDIMNQSKSALVQDIAQLTSMVNALRDYIIGEASGPFPVINIIWSMIMYAAIFFNITNILICFIIPAPQLKRIFMPLHTDEGPDKKGPFQKGSLILIVVLSMLTIILFVLLDHQIGEINKAGHFSYIQQFIQRQIERFSIFYK